MVNPRVGSRCVGYAIDAVNVVFDAENFLAVESHVHESLICAGSQKSRRRRAIALVFEAPRSALHAILYQVRPDKLDYARVVVAISEAVIESGEAMLLTGFFHARQLLRIKSVRIDVSPVKS